MRVQGFAGRASFVRETDAVRAILRDAVLVDVFHVGLSEPGILPLPPQPTHTSCSLVEARPEPPHAAHGIFVNPPARCGHTSSMADNFRGPSRIRHKRCTWPSRRTLPKPSPFLTCLRFGAKLLNSCSVAMACSRSQKKYIASTDSRATDFKRTDFQPPSPGR